MTATQMYPCVGAEVMVRFEGLVFACKVVDVKTAWSKVRLQVQPVQGNGLQWVELGRVESINPQAKESR